MNRSIDFPQRSLLARRHLVPDADRRAAVHGGRSDGVGALPHRAAADRRPPSASRHPDRCLGHRHEAARQDRRGALPDRGGRRARSAALPRGMGGSRSASSVPARRARHVRPAADSRETIRTRARGRDAARGLRSRRGHRQRRSWCWSPAIPASASRRWSTSCTRCSLPPRGLFASGKFDQYKRDIPYATLAQASRASSAICWARATRSWRAGATPLREALGPNGQLIVDLIPELGLVIGTQPPVRRTCRRRTHRAVSSWCSGASSACSRGRSIRWRCSSTICNGSTRRRSTCSSTC